MHKIETLSHMALQWFRELVAFSQRGPGFDPRTVHVVFAVVVVLGQVFYGVPPLSRQYLPFHVSIIPQKSILTLILLMWRIG